MLHSLIAELPVFFSFKKITFKYVVNISKKWRKGIRNKIQNNKFISSIYKKNCPKLSLLLNTNQIQNLFNVKLKCKIL